MADLQIDDDALLSVSKALTDAASELAAIGLGFGETAGGVGDADLSQAVDGFGGFTGRELQRVGGEMSRLGAQLSEAVAELGSVDAHLAAAAGRVVMGDPTFMLGM